MRCSQCLGRASRIPLVVSRYKSILAPHCERRLFDVCGCQTILLHQLRGFAALSEGVPYADPLEGYGIILDEVFAYGRTHPSHDVVLLRRDDAAAPPRVLFEGLPVEGLDGVEVYHARLHPAPL